MSVLPVSADYPIHTPHADLIRDEAEAIAVAHRVAAVLLEQDAERDRTRQVPAKVVDLYSNSGLWGISVPREFGGAQVSYAVLAQVIAIISAADPSLGQIPQTTTACWKTFACKTRPSSRRISLAWHCRGIVLPMRCRKPAARTCRTFKRRFAAKATVM